MKQLITFILIALCGTGFAQQSPLKKLQGLSHPESVIFDKEQQVLFVSNMADKKESDGFISKISAEGKIMDTLWVEGLNDPKGLLVRNDKLFVTDVTSLVEMNRKTGEILRRIEVKNAESLNDITADDEGNLYVSDLAGNSIYKMDISGNISEWLNHPELERPNGLLVSNNQLYVASWGKEAPGNLLKINLKTKEIEQVTKSGIGNLDGIQEISPESFYVSDWATGTIYRIGTNGNVEKVVQTAKSSGDILFLKDIRELVIPMNHQNELWWIKAD